MNQTITVNEIDINILHFKSENYVAIKPICEAIGVNYTTQIDKILKDCILKSVVPLRGTTGADGKTYKMYVIPLRYVFGWLFTINPNNVNPEIKQKVINYKMECYDALFDTFTKRTSILKEKSSIQNKIDKLELDWKRSKEYLSIIELKKKQLAKTRILNQLDKSIISNQLKLFKN